MSDSILDDCLRSTRFLSARYDKAPRSIRRWVVNGTSPAADLVINNRNYWRQSTIDRHERKLVAERHAQRAVAETTTTAAS